MKIKLVTVLEGWRIAPQIYRTKPKADRHPNPSSTASLELGVGIETVPEGTSKALVMAYRERRMTLCNELLRRYRRYGLHSLHS